MVMAGMRTPDQPGHQGGHEREAGRDVRCGLVSCCSSFVPSVPILVRTCNARSLVSCRVASAPRSPAPAVSWLGVLQAKQVDDNRNAQLLAHLTAEGHPYHRFGWGDARSLKLEPEGLMEQARDPRQEPSRVTCEVSSAS